jgi:DNA-binding NarL/FixJ family response regulator
MLEVLRIASLGHSNTEIAAKLYLSLDPRASSSLLAP